MLCAVVWLVVCCGACGGGGGHAISVMWPGVEWHVAWFNLFYVRAGCVKNTTKKNFNHIHTFLKNKNLCFAAEQFVFNASEK